MRVVAIEAFRFFYNHVPVDVAKGDVIDSDAAVFLLTAGASVRPDDDDAQTEYERLDLVRGEMVLGDQATADDAGGALNVEANATVVLTWVGEDPERAAEALDAELAKDRPRSTLVKQLEKLAGKTPEA